MLIIRNTIKIIAMISIVTAVSACSGMRRTGDSFTAHAESFNILGLRIPGDDHDRATRAVPAGAQVNTVFSSPSDWTSLLGIINRIIGISITEISGEVQPK